MAEVIERAAGVKKVAAFLIALGVKNAGPLLRNLEEEELEDVTVEISNMSKLSPEIVEKVLLDYYELMTAKRHMAQGGLEVAQKMLERTFGRTKARNLLEKVKTGTEITGFKLPETINPHELLNFLQKEHPQTIALILASMKPLQAAEILSDLPATLQGEVAYRLATMGETSPELLKDIEEALTMQMEGAFDGQRYSSGGIKAIAEILSSVSHSAESNIMESMVQKDPEMATEIQKLLFVFEDLVILRDRDIQRIMKDFDTKTIATTLKVASEKLQEKIFSNMSQQAAEALKEEMEYLGPVRVIEVEEAQRRIIDHVQELETSGEIMGRGGQGDFIE
ncbi:MAG: flagellar motor switch protein FliG [bacterium]